MLESVAPAVHLEGEQSNMTWDHKMDHAHVDGLRSTTCRALEAMALQPHALGSLHVRETCIAMRSNDCEGNGSFMMLLFFFHPASLISYRWKGNMAQS